MDGTVECLKKRCKNVQVQINSLPTAKVTQSCKHRLLKLVQAELNFLSRSPPPSGPISTNIGYVESIVHVVQQPTISGVSCVCKTIQGPLQGRSLNSDLRGAHVDVVCTYNGKPAWFVVSDRNPKYISWSDKGNRKGFKTRLHFLLEAASCSAFLQPISVILCFANGIDANIAQRLKDDFRAVEICDFKQTSAGTQNGTEGYRGMRGTCSVSDIFQDVEGGEWVNIFGVKETCIENSRDVHEQCHDGSSYGIQGWIVFEIEVSQEDNVRSKYAPCQTGRVNVEDKNWLEQIYTHEDTQLDQLEDSLFSQTVVQLEDSLFSQTVVQLEEHIPQSDQKFYSLVSSMNLPSNKLVNDKEIISLKSSLINMDTTALVALVSELSNGYAKTLVEMSTEDMNKHFKSTASFMREQAQSELEQPLMEDMASILAGKRAIISECVHNEFKDLISMCSGPNEKRRAECLLKCTMVLPNNPSVRVMGLPETGKIKLKHKVIFGTGDHWQAPTLTANMGFVRAVLQTGMSLSVVEHRPRALVGC